MQKKSQAIFKHFGEKQKLKAEEEWIELEIAKLELKKHDIKVKQGFYDKDIVLDVAVKRLELVDNCNEELGDNVLMCMQLNNFDFEESLDKLLYGCNYDNAKNYDWLDVEKVRKTVQEKIDRTIKKYGIEV